MSLITELRGIRARMMSQARTNLEMSSKSGSDPSNNRRSGVDGSPNSGHWESKGLCCRVARPTSEAGQVSLPPISWLDEISLVLHLRFKTCCSWRRRNRPTRNTCLVGDQHSPKPPVAGRVGLLPMRAVQDHLR